MLNQMIIVQMAFSLKEGYSNSEEKVNKGCSANSELYFFFSISSLSTVIKGLLSNCSFLLLSFAININEFLIYYAG